MSLFRSTRSNLIKIFVVFSDYTLPTNTNSMLRQNCFVEEETGVGIELMMNKCRRGGKKFQNTNTIDGAAIFFHFALLKHPR